MKIRTKSANRTKSKRYRVGSRSNKPKYFWRNKKIRYPLGDQFQG